MNTAFHKQINSAVAKEYKNALEALKRREDYREELDYFIEVLCSRIAGQDFKVRNTKPLVGLHCVQAPYELFDALGFQPVRLCNGSFNIQRLSAHCVPTLTCPVIKSCVGSYQLEDSIEKLCDLTVLPTTCDWIVKLPEMVGAQMGNLHIMDLPHVKYSEKGQQRWLEEIYALKQMLEKHSGKRLKRKDLLKSSAKYMRAMETAESLE